MAGWLVDCRLRRPWAGVLERAGVVVALMLDFAPRIRTLGPGEIIREDGFYNIPIERHHSQCCDGVSVTSGILRKMELYSPLEVWAFHDLNPERWEPLTSDALNEGAALAALLEGGMPALLERFVVLDADAPSRPTAAQRAAFARTGKWSDSAAPRAAFWDEVEASGKVALKPAQVQLLVDMARTLAVDPAAQAALDGEPEITMAVYDEETDLWKMARPDLVNFDGMVNDFKKMNAGGRPFDWRLVDRRIEDNGYDMQLAFAAECFEALTGFWPEEAAIVAQSDARPHPVIVREISEEDLRLGQFRNRAALRRFRECLDSGRWPGPGEDVGAFQRSEKGRERLMMRMDIQTAPEAPETEASEPTMMG